MTSHNVLWHGMMNSKGREAQQGEQAAELHSGESSPAYRCSRCARPAAVTAGQAAPAQVLLLFQRSWSWQHGSLPQPSQCQHTAIWPSVAPAGSVL